jgi:endonuclease V-like protein UPF0215 family
VPAARPHLIGIDDGPFAKGVDRDTALVAVFMEGADLVEGVAISRFPIDGDGVSEFLARWIIGLRFHPAAQAIVFGGITIAGLALIDAPALAAATGIPVLIVNRRPPQDAGVAQALCAAGFAERLETLARAPQSIALASGLHVAFAGAGERAARELIAASTRKSALPEPLRVAHLIAAALERGASRGRA